MSESVLQVIQLIDQQVPPDLEYPRINRVAAIAPVAVDNSVGIVLNALGQRMIQWTTQAANPLAPGLTVVRMFRRSNGIKVYSVSNDGKIGILHFIPISQVLLTEEAMGPKILLAELEACELLEDENPPDPDDDPNDPELPEAPEATEAPAAANGQSPS